MSVYLRGDVYQCELVIKGKRYRKSTGFTGKREAKEWENRWRVEILSGRADGGQTITLGAAIDRYVREELGPRAQKAGTWRSARYNLDLVKRHFGADRPLTQLDTRAVAEWRSSMLASGLKPSSTNRRLSDLRAILNRAHKSWGVLATVPHFELCRLPAQQDRDITDAHFEAILAHLPEHARTLALFLVGSAARLSEATGLKWKHVAPDCSTVSFSATKNGRVRVTPLPRATQELLRSLQRGQDEQFVFLFNGRKFENMRTAWSRARRLANAEHFRVHDCRGLAATRLIKRGVNLAVVARYLGHSYAAVTARFYTHLGTDDVARALTVLDGPVG